ncbi:FeoB-associated Cys-rich membrane protein [Parasphaerochaeta coccoides]|uniref:FeoB-associated Cys-rich membrane protein n=1 Tax=Parasphaerochaeta coccoides (strain ATCC BAA-1237 / DSM 17374 / SPN1) TaxID=760011 RepID=F4GIQ2_PARC1|nr:FeoB-associated Cys-rich membrane protein [Parasphaerochaeta coccoides]AEC02186.1 hypothetical protein Spico_0962 [Parasphaerochaeta coccoides DSM 17374]
MKFVDLLILIPIAVALFFVVRHLIRTNKAGGCASCPSCKPVKKDAMETNISDSCPSCHLAQEMTRKLDEVGQTDK